MRPSLTCETPFALGVGLRHSVSASRLFPSCHNVCFSTCRLLPWFFVCVGFCFYLFELIGLCEARRVIKRRVQFMLCPSRAPTATFNTAGGTGGASCSGGKGSSRLMAACHSSSDKAKQQGFSLQPGPKSCGACVCFSRLRGRHCRPGWYLLRLLQPLCTGAKSPWSPSRC